MKKQDLFPTQFDRAQSPCPTWERCGSCEWSHVPYVEQCSEKSRRLTAIFAAYAASIGQVPVAPSPRTAHYRNRMDFPIDFEGRVGLREKGKWWRVIDDHHCFISDERIERIFTEVREWSRAAGLSYFDRKKHTGFLRYAVIRTSGVGNSNVDCSNLDNIGEAMLTLITSALNSEPAQDKLENALQKLSSSTSATQVLLGINNTVRDVSVADELRLLRGVGHITENIDGVSYCVTPNAFFQTNTLGAKQLQKIVLEMCGPLSEKKVLDLYCGSGFFALACAKNGANVVGVEFVAEAIRDARLNSENNRLNVEFHDALVEKFDWRKYDPEILIVDPPRAGLHPKALEHVCEARIPRLIYVSCNPSQLGRELDALSKTYEPVKAMGVDMFPHTPHVELVVQFERRS